MLNPNTFVNFTRAVQSVNLIKNRKQIAEEMEDGKSKKKTVRIGDCRTQEESEKLTEAEITETTFHRTCRIRRGALDRSGSDSFEEDSCTARAVVWDQIAEETKNLLSIWDLVSKDQEMSGNIKELEAVTQMVTSSPRAGTSSAAASPTRCIIEVPRRMTTMVKRSAKFNHRKGSTNDKLNWRTHWRTWETSGVSA